MTGFDELKGKKTYLRSLRISAVAVVSVRGKLYGTSTHLGVMHL